LSLKGKSDASTSVSDQVIRTIRDGSSPVRDVRHKLGPLHGAPTRMHRGPPGPRGVSRNPRRGPSMCGARAALLAAKGCPIRCTVYLLGGAVFRKRRLNQNEPRAPQCVLPTKGYEPRANIGLGVRF